MFKFNDGWISKDSFGKYKFHYDKPVTSECYESYYSEGCRDIHLPGTITELENVNWKDSLRRIVNGIIQPIYEHDEVILVGGYEDKIIYKRYFKEFDEISGEVICYADGRSSKTSYSSHDITRWKFHKKLD